MQKPVNEWGSGCTTGEEGDREKEETCIIRCQRREA